MTYKFLKFSITSLILIFLSGCSFWLNENQRFAKWQSGFYIRALNEGVSQATLDKSFAQVFLSRKHVKHDKKQFTRERTFQEYYDNAVNDRLVRKGKYRLRKYRTLLKNVAHKYSVPQKYVVALWGNETRFGKYTGNYNVINSLANLAYEGRRREFFESELIYALKMVEKGVIQPNKFKGSWAGAFGQCQFMPSSYHNFAVDYNSNGKANIWTDPRDIFASIANYLANYNWDPKTPWGYEVKIPKAAYQYLDKKIKLSDISQFKIEKIKDRRKFTSYEKGQIIMLRKISERYFITFNNFDILKQWNNSNYFALTVGKFAETIGKR